MAIRFLYRRREFIALLGGAAAAWPLAARAQQPGMPVIGFLRSTSSDTNADLLREFRQGLRETGYAEGENVAFEYRWADNHVDRLPELAADLVSRRVAVIATGAPPSAFAAKAATTTIPIVFVVAEDPVKLGLVASLARPGGNLTGINFFAVELAAKRLELLRDLVPGAARLAVLVDPANAAITEGTVVAVETAARAMGLEIKVLNASTSREIDFGLRNFCAGACRMPIDRLAFTPDVSSRARSPRTCRSCNRPSSNWLLIYDPTHSSSAAAPSSPPGVSNWPNGQHATRFPRYMRAANMPWRAA